MMAGMTETARAQADCVDWQHHGMGHYRPTIVSSNAEILVFETCPRARAGETCGTCAGSGRRYETVTLPDGQQVLKLKGPCPSCADGRNHIAWR